MIFKASKRFLKSYRILPEKVKTKVKKTLSLLQTNPRYPSLHTKKLVGKTDLWEARVDISYRVTFTRVGEIVFLEDVGPHDVLR